MINGSIPPDSSDFLLEFRRRLLWPCPHVPSYPDTFENRDFFFLRYSLPSTLKRRFRATKMQVFGNGNAGLSFSRGQTKTEVFKNADAIHYSHHAAHAL